MANDSSVAGFLATTLLSVFGKIFMIVNAITLAYMSQGIAIVVGLSTLYINWPKIKARTRDIIRKIKK